MESDKESDSIKVYFFSSLRISYVSVANFQVAFFLR